MQHLQVLRRDSREELGDAKDLLPRGSNARAFPF